MINAFNHRAALLGDGLRSSSHSGDALTQRFANEMPVSSPPACELNANAVELFGVRIHAVCMSSVLAILQRWLEDGDQTCRYVVTPNVDHVVKLQSNFEMQAAYRRASLVVADGWPLVAASRLLRKPLPERVAGSDIVPRLFSLSSAGRPLRVFLLGAAPGVGETAKRRIEQRWPHVNICGTLSPPIGFERSAELNEEIATAINAARPELLVVGLGAPKQEIWLATFHERLRTKVAIAAGATIDFLAGRQKRAPRWVQAIGMEWFHRVARDPRRLAKRYLHDAWAFPWIVMKECVGLSPARSEALELS